ncbi:hypothetical protein [Azotobacter chroococcum]|uniref:Uncharacterized protein n=1 Tax=Azotobacter chroococcum TaxID=353 RepID=A0AAQ0C160_9GAMM|nr:hypothetical protein [Azotobacter chroococcum]QQE90465.1 hypothetical protein GKQ51_09410 [Azotobacter chroococcum]
MSSDNGTGRPCPDCGEPMSDIRSQRARVCTNGKCGLVVGWELKPGQPPLINNNRADRMNPAATRSAARMNPAAVDELALHGWPEADDSPRQQRIEQGGELAEVYEVLDRAEGGQRG